MSVEPQPDLSPSTLPADWVVGHLTGRQDLAPGLATFQVEAPTAPHTPGQFLMLGLPDERGELVRRAYSVASAPGAPLEFLIVRVPEGALTPRLFNLPTGGALGLSRAAAGIFTLDRVPSARDLWLISTGTGLAPYLAMLRAGELWARFEQVVLVHGVRQVADLAARDELVAMGPRLSYLPCVTRQPGPPLLPATAGDGPRPFLRGRIPDLLREGALEALAGRRLSATDSQVLLCGNPDMIRDLQPMLEARDLRRNRRAAPGQLTIERYW